LGLLHIPKLKPSTVHVIEIPSRRYANADMKLSLPLSIIEDT